MNFIYRKGVSRPILRRKDHVLQPFHFYDKLQSDMKSESVRR